MRNVHDGNRNFNWHDAYFFKKYYAWRGESRIARTPTDVRVVADDVMARLSRLRRFDESDIVYAMTLVQAWEDGCQTGTCVGECSCEHRDFPYKSVHDRIAWAQETLEK